MISEAREHDNILSPTPANSHRPHERRILLLRCFPQTRVLMMVMLVLECAGMDRWRGGRTGGYHLVGTRAAGARVQRFVLLRLQWGEVAGSEAVMGC